MVALQPADGVSPTSARLASLGFLSRSSEDQTRASAIDRLARWQCTHSVGSAETNGEARFRRQRPTSLSACGNRTQWPRSASHPSIMSDPAYVDRLLVLNNSARFARLNSRWRLLCVK